MYHEQYTWYSTIIYHFILDLYQCTVRENTTGSVPDCKLSATDNDTGVNGNLTYKSLDNVSIGTSLIRRLQRNIWFMKFIKHLVFTSTASQADSQENFY